MLEVSDQLRHAIPAGPPTKQLSNIHQYDYIIGSLLDIPQGHKLSNIGTKSRDGEEPHTGGVTSYPRVVLEDGY